MLSDAAKIEIVKPHLRREYANDLEGLKLKAKEIFGAATDTVTLTNGSFEGGSGSGEITFPKILLLGALNDLIAEIDPGYLAPTLIPRREIGITVRLGC